MWHTPEDKNRRKRKKELCIISEASRLETCVSRSYFHSELHFFSCLDSNSSFPQHLITNFSPLKEKRALHDSPWLIEKQSEAMRPCMDQSRPHTAIVTGEVPSLIMSNPQKLFQNVPRAIISGKHFIFRSQCEIIRTRMFYEACQEHLISSVTPLQVTKASTGTQKKREKWCREVAH